MGLFSCLALFDVELESSFLVCFRIAYLFDVRVSLLLFFPRFVCLFFLLEVFTHSFH